MARFATASITSARRIWRSPSSATSSPQPPVTAGWSVDGAAADLATCSGSGRRNTSSTSAAARNAGIASRNNPVGAGNPTAPARTPAEPRRLGPATAPTLAAATTALIDRARRLERSAAA